MTGQDETARQMLHDYFKEYKAETNDKLKSLFKTVAELSNAVAKLSEKSHTMVQVQDQYSETQAQLSDQFRRITRQLNKLSTQAKDAKTLASQSLVDARDLRQMIHKLVVLANKYKSEHATIKEDLRNQSGKIRKITRRIDNAETDIETSKTTLRTLKWVGSGVIAFVTLMGTLISIYIAIFGPIAKTTGKG